MKNLLLLTFAGLGERAEKNRRTLKMVFIRSNSVIFVRNFVDVCIRQTRRFTSDYRIWRTVSYRIFGIAKRSISGVRDGIFA